MTSHVLTGLAHPSRDAPDMPSRWNLNEKRLSEGVTAEVIPKTIPIPAISHPSHTTSYEKLPKRKKNTSKNKIEQMHRKETT